jgi:prepilin-type N-terminal cleavage/methylation domain-containing protein
MIAFSGGGSLKSLVLSGFRPVKKFKKLFNPAFTLAEVLITLGIIGVVAAMTIPSLMTKIKFAKYRTAFRKDLAILNQAVKMNYANYGWDFAGLHASSNSECYKLGQGEDNTPDVNKTMCALINGNITGKTFLGNLFGDNIEGFNGYDNNNWSNNQYNFPAGNSQYNYILYQLSNSTVIGLPPAHYDSSSSYIGGCTKKDSNLSYNGSIDRMEPNRYCLGFIAVDRKVKKHRVISCAGGDNSSNMYWTQFLSEENHDACLLEKDIGDIMPIIFYDQTVAPATNAALALFEGYGTSKTASSSSSSGSASSYASGSSSSYASGSASSYSSSSSYTCNNYYHSCN